MAEVAPLFMVDIDAKGALSVDGKALARPEELVGLARAAHARDPEVRAIIRADRSSSWENVVVALDRIKQGSISKIAFAVEAPRR